MFTLAKYHEITGTYVIIPTGTLSGRQFVFSYAHKNLPKLLVQPGGINIKM